MIQRTLTLTWMKVEYEGSDYGDPNGKGQITTYVNVNGGEWSEVASLTENPSDALDLFGKFAIQGESRIAKFNSRMADEVGV